MVYIIKIVTINDQIRDEKLQYDINGEAAKILASKELFQVITFYNKVFFSHTIVFFLL